jgi:nicotinate-nucleotide pyrophosphorylase (carboxylating)
MEQPGMERSERRSLPRMITPLSTPAYDRDSQLRFPLKQGELQKVVRAALDEDQAFNDITTIATVVSDRRAGSSTRRRRFASTTRTAGTSGKGSRCSR